MSLDNVDKLNQLLQDTQDGKIRDSNPTKFNEGVKKLRDFLEQTE